MFSGAQESGVIVMVGMSAVAIKGMLGAFVGVVLFPQPARNIVKMRADELKMVSRESFFILSYL